MKLSEDKHERLIQKLEMELINYYKKSVDNDLIGRVLVRGKWYGIMEEIIIVLKYEKLSDDLIDKMLLHNNLLEDMANYFYEDDDKILDLFKKNTYEFIEMQNWL